MVVVLIEYKKGFALLPEHLGGLPQSSGENALNAASCEVHPLSRKDLCYTS